MLRDDELTYYEMPYEERKKVIERIKSVLEQLDCIELVVVFGGFVKSRYFKDIDVGVIVKNDVNSLDKELSYMVEIEESIRKKLKIEIPVDIRILNTAPPDFKRKVLKEGIIIIDRREK